MLSSTFICSRCGSVKAICEAISSLLGHETHERRKVEKRKFSLGKKKKKAGPKKRTIQSRKQRKFGSWYNQSELLLTSSNTCEIGKEIGASSSKIHSSRRVRSEEEDWNSDSNQSESELEFDDADRPNTLAVVNSWVARDVIIF